MIEVKRSEEFCYLSYDEAFLKTGEKMDEILCSAPGPVRPYTGYLKGARGKMIRAGALLSCAIDDTGGVHPDAVRLAAAIEILHLATLIHDDIIDEADTRRGIKSLQKRYDKKTAVICGDYLLFEALKTAASVEKTVPDEEMALTKYVGRICSGELMQHIQNGNLNLSVYRYLSIISGKTAALFEASFHGGAVLCGNGETDVNRLRKLGYYTGMIFQLVDDCQDFECTKVKAKKNVRSDYEQGVITLPVIYTFLKDGSLKERAANSSIGKRELLKEVASAGGLAYTHAIAGRYFDKATKVLNELSISDYKRKKLAGILEKAYCGLKKPAEKRTEFDNEVYQKEGLDRSRGHTGHSGSPLSCVE